MRRMIRLKFLWKIDMDDVNMTADEAVQKAKDYGLVGGDPDNESHWVSGYNFKMSYASLERV